MARALAEVTNMVPEAFARKAMNNALPLIRSVNVGTLSAVNANTSAEQTVTLAGLGVGDFVSINKPTAQAGLGIVGARVTAANTLGITFIDATASPITPTASEIYLVLHASILAP